MKMKVFLIDLCSISSYGDECLFNRSLFVMEMSVFLIDLYLSSYGDEVLLIDLYSISSYGDDGSVWFSSELKALQAHCGHFEAFPPGNDLDK